MTKIITRDKLEEFVETFAKPRNGLYYGYGEYFEPDPKYSTDCSGLVMSSGAWFQGMNPWQRYGSTESFRLKYKICYDLGFLPGPGGPEHFFKVGLQHGGGGMYSHTACSINGVGWESRGDGVIYGSAKIGGRTLYARQWNDPLFHDFWHWDGVLEDNFFDSFSESEVDELLACFRQWSFAS